MTDISLDLGAKLEVVLGNLARHLESNDRKQQEILRRQARMAQAPVLSKLPWSGVCNASGFGAFLNSGQGIEGPDMGFIWYVRRISILGSAVGAALSGRADVFISAADYPNSYNNINQFSSGDWQDGTATLPSNAFYGRGEMPLRFNESLTIVISGSTANAVVSGQIVFEQFEEAAFKQEWGI